MRPLTILKVLLSATVMLGAVNGAVAPGSASPSTCPLGTVWSSAQTKCVNLGGGSTAGTSVSSGGPGIGISGQAISSNGGSASPGVGIGIGGTGAGGGAGVGIGGSAVGVSGRTGAAPAVSLPTSSSSTNGFLYALDDNGGSLTLDNTPPPAASKPTVSPLPSSQSALPPPTKPVNSLLVGTSLTPSSSSVSTSPTTTPSNPPIKSVSPSTLTSNSASTYYKPPQSTTLTYPTPTPTPQPNRTPTDSYATPVLITNADYINPDVIRWKVLEEVQRQLQMVGIMSRITPDGQFSFNSPTTSYSSPAYATASQGSAQAVGSSVTAYGTPSRTIIAIGQDAYASGGD